MYVENGEYIYFMHSTSSTSDNNYHRKRIATQNMRVCILTETVIDSLACCMLPIGADCGDVDACVEVTLRRNNDAGESHHHGVLIFLGRGHRGRRC